MMDKQAQEAAATISSLVLVVISSAGVMEQPLKGCFVVRDTFIQVLLRNDTESCLFFGNQRLC